VAEPGVEPGLSETTALQAAERSVAHFRRGVDAGTRTLFAGLTTRILDPSGRPPCAMKDSNLRPAGCGPAALPTELIALAYPRPDSNWQPPGS
jgi:hypothetical protein